MQKERFILSLGGSIIFPEEIDIDFIKGFRNLIIEEVKKGKEFIIITGGGKICRKYQHALGEITNASDEDKDWVGIYTTQMNAKFMRMVFGEYSSDNYLFNIYEKVEMDKPVMFGAGWEPGKSTDYDAVILAKQHNVKTIVNLSNIEKVYTKDPNKFDDAEPIDNITWANFRKIVGDKWTPGLNMPFDPIASKEAEELGLRVAALGGHDLENLKSFLDGGDFHGTVIEG